MAASLLLQYGSTPGGIDAGGRANAVEFLNLVLDAGADRVLVEDLTGLGVEIIGVDLGEDNSADEATLLASTLDDHVLVSAQKVVDPETGDEIDAVTVEGLSATVILRQSTTADRLRVEGREGADDLKANVGAEDFIGIILDGGEGDDILSADATLLGGPGNDVFYLLAGTNVIDGRTGFDQIIVDGTDGNDQIVVSQNLTVVTIDVNGQQSVNTTTNVERIAVNGLDGNDTISLAALAIPTIVEAGQGDDVVNATTTVAVAVTVYGGDGNDTVDGGALGDLIHGGAGADTIRGRGGNDTISGGSGNDIITGGLGDDQLYGDEDSDTFLWDAGDGNDTVEGGTGQDAQVVTGLAAASNRITVSSGPLQANRVLVSWADLGAGTGAIDMAAVEHASLVGGTAPDLRKPTLKCRAGKKAKKKVAGPRKFDRAG